MIFRARNWKPRKSKWMLDEPPRRFASRPSTDAEWPAASARGLGRVTELKPRQHGHAFRCFGIERTSKGCCQAGAAFSDHVTDDDDVGIARSGRRRTQRTTGSSIQQAKFCSAEMGTGDVHADSPLIGAGFGPNRNLPIKAVSLPLIKSDNPLTNQGYIALVREWSSIRA